MKLAEAIETLVNAYGDLDSIARSLPVDASELYAATVDADTAEAVAVAVLKKYNPAPVKAAKEK